MNALVLNFADANGDKAQAGGFFRFDSVSVLWQTAEQLADAGYRVWFDRELSWLQPPARVEVSPTHQDGEPQ